MRMYVILRLVDGALTLETKPTLMWLLNGFIVAHVEFRLGI